MLASDYLFDFTEGRVAVGTVTVRQNYAGWADADLKLHTSNTLRPNANIGGIVSDRDARHRRLPSRSAIRPAASTWAPTGTALGRRPNQVNTYKGVVVPPAALAADWAIALAHEFGHYLLFLFDTYTDANGHSSEIIAAQCTGSAMANAYEPANQAFVFDQRHWDTACGATEAHAQPPGPHRMGHHHGLVSLARDHLRPSCTASYRVAR